MLRNGLEAVLGTLRLGTRLVVSWAGATDSRATIGCSWNNMRRKIRRGEQMIGKRCTKDSRRGEFIYKIKLYVYQHCSSSHCSIRLALSACCYAPTPPVSQLFFLVLRYKGCDGGDNPQAHGLWPPSRRTALPPLNIRPDIWWLSQTLTRSTNI